MHTACYVTSHSLTPLEIQAYELSTHVAKAFPTPFSSTAEKSCWYRTIVNAAGMRAGIKVLLDCIATY